MEPLATGKNNSSIQNKLEKLKDYMNYYVDCICSQQKAHYRIIIDEEIKFPRNYELMNHDPLIELSHIPWDKHSHRGWNKPDKQIGDIEIRYLWKEFHWPAPFKV